MQFESNYYAIVMEQSTGLGAFELLADPQTGAVSRDGSEHDVEHQVQPDA